jgi:hypothetical protein
MWLGAEADRKQMPLASLKKKCQEGKRAIGYVYGCIMHIKAKNNYSCFKYAAILYALCRRSPH